MKCKIAPSRETAEDPDGVSVECSSRSKGTIEDVLPCENVESKVEQKPTGVTCKAHCCCVHTKIMLMFTVNPLCVSKLNKLVFNQYLMFRFTNI